MTVQWIPSHCGIQGNEIADTLAAEGSTQPQDDALICYDAAKAAIRRAAFAKWNESEQHAQPDWHATIAGPSPILPDKVGLDRNRSVLLSQIRTGHCPILRSYLHRIGRASTPTCPDCQEEDDTAEHLLLRCRAHTTIRLQTFGPDNDISDPLKVISFVERVGRLRPPV